MGGKPRVRPTTAMLPTRKWWRRKSATMWDYGDDNYVWAETVKTTDDRWVVEISFRPDLLAVFDSLPNAKAYIVEKVPSRPEWSK